MALRRSRPTTPATEAARGAVRLGPAVDDVLQRSHRGDVAVLDVVDLSAAQAQALVGRGLLAVVVIGSLRTGGEVLSSAGLAVVEQVGTALWTMVGEGTTVVVDPRSGEICDDEGRVLAQGVVRPPELLGPDLSDGPARTAQLLRDASSLVGEMPGIDDPDMVSALRDLQAGHRPVAVVGAGACDTRHLRRWVARVGPVIICTDGGLGNARRAGLRVDVLVSRAVDPAAAMATGATIVVGDAARGSALPDEVSALLVARAAGSSVVATWGIATGRDALLRLPREAGALQLAAVLSCAALPLDGPALVTSVPPSSPFGALAVALAGLAAGLVVLGLSDPGLAFLHRVLG